MPAIQRSSTGSCSLDESQRAGRRFSIHEASSLLIRPWIVTTNLVHASSHACEQVHRLLGLHTCSVRDQVSAVQAPSASSVSAVQALSVSSQSTHGASLATRPERYPCTTADRHSVQYSLKLAVSMLTAAMGMMRWGMLVSMGLLKPCLRSVNARVSAA